MSGQDYQQAAAWVHALTGQDPSAAVIDWRALHDTERGAKGYKLRGTLPQVWNTLLAYQAEGRGIFAKINEMDGAGGELNNVLWNRAQVADLDNISSQINFDRACQWSPQPSFAVQTSEIYDDHGRLQRSKWHVYWSCAPYRDNDRYSLIQRKLRQWFDGDKSVVDASRVLRVPGTLHLKNPSRPFLVKCFALGGYGHRYDATAFETALAHVNATDVGGTRHELGEPSLAAPSLDWLNYALSLSDPNDLDRTEWIALTSAIKQAGWTLADPVTLRAMWESWCARYEGNDAAENNKQWESIRSTQLGWNSIVARVPQLKQIVAFGLGQQAAPAATPVEPGQAAVPAMPVPSPPALDCSGPMLTAQEQAAYFKGVVFVTNLGLMLTKNNRFLNVTQFNALYGGKKFIIDETGKVTNEAWAAATRSTLWTVPKVDHIRFIPTEEYHVQITDDMDRTGVNTYKPVTVRRVKGDPSPFLRHVAMLIPDPSDQRVLLDFLAHNAKYPGHKIPWAPVIQSTEGAGKGVFKRIISHMMGRHYCYFPSARELAKSGAQFNAWMRNKLFILADEIKVDEKRDLIEILKPMISEDTIEIQAKGQDQDIEDNFSNWTFFTNWKDAIPVNKNGRRYSIFYSPLQTAYDLLERKMGDAYFKALYDWLDADGAAIVADWFLEYPIERGAIPMRAPSTTSMAEAVRISRGPVERLIADAVEDQLPGFMGGYVSLMGLMKRLKESSVRAVSQGTVEGILQGMGYVMLGRAQRAYPAEHYTERSTVFAIDPRLSLEQFGRVQGWE